MLYFYGFFFLHFKEVPKDEEYSGYCTEGGNIWQSGCAFTPGCSFFLSRFWWLPFSLVKAALSELLNKILAT